MDHLTDTSYLCSKLIEINKKYESTSFIDIDFIDLFSLRTMTAKTMADIKNIKKKITTIYYKLMLKYHSDKFMSHKENVIKINNCFICVDEIKSGQFASFINDIYEMFNEMLLDVSGLENFLEIISSNTDDVLNKFDINSDFYNLKRRFDMNINSKDYLKASDEQIKEFKTDINKIKIVDSKINGDQIKSLINSELQNRANSINTERLFTEKEQLEDGFNEKFNNVFDSAKNLNTDTSEQLDTNSINTDIVAYNYDDNCNLSFGNNATNLTNCITELSEAFKPIRVNNIIKTQQLTYEDLLTQRKEQEDFFKNPKNQKKTIT